MIHAKDHKQGYLFDPWDYLGAKRRKLLDESWAGLFREHILNELPVEQLARCFSAGFGRPTKELYTVLAALERSQKRRCCPPDDWRLDKGIHCRRFFKEQTFPFPTMRGFSFMM